jgi:hypothetical protein
MLSVSKMAAASGYSRVNEAGHRIRRRLSVCWPRLASRDIGGEVGVDVELACAA